MDISSVNADLIRGNSTTIILGALWSRDRYGYEIIQEIDEKTGGQYKVKQATLYNQLKKLEKAGLITSYDGAPDDTSGGRRRYYSLTIEGRNFLTKEKSEYEYSRTILDKLISEQEFDFTKPAPFDTEGLRPYTKTGEEEKPKVVYKEKVVEKPVEVIKEVEVVKEVPVEVVKEVPVEVVKEVQVEVEKETKVYIDADGNVISEEEARQIAENARLREEERQARESETMKPASSLAEMFARFDAQSEYEQKNESEYVVAPTPVDESAVKYEEPAQDHTYFTAFAGENGSRTRSQSSLKEIFERLERQEAEIDSKNAEQEANEVEETASDVQSEPVQDHEFYESELVSDDKDVDRTGVTASVIGKRDENFEYENKNVNYRDFFSSIVSVPEEKEPARQESTVSYDQDLKSRLYQKGFKIRPYDRGNTSEYYTFNFIHSNRINRDSWLLVMALYIVEVAIMWVSLIGKVSYAYFLSFMLVGSALMLIPTVICMINPSKRVRANFNFKLSIINRGMIFIELTVVCILIGFFAVGASIHDTILILETMVLPAVLLTNLPISSVVYYLLYRSRKYHTV